MSITKTLLATIAAALAFAALPAAVSAVTLDGISEEEPELSASGSGLTLFGPATISCESTAATSFLTKKPTTGHIQFLIQGCKGPFGITCTSSGQEAGKITTTSLEFHLSKLPGEPIPLTLITPNEGHIASFTCSAFFNIKVVGNGVIGQLTSPGFGESSNDAEVQFAVNEAKEQTYSTVKGDETEYRLELTLNGGEPEPAAVSSAGVAALPKGEEGTLTEE